MNALRTIGSSAVLLLFAGPALAVFCESNEDARYMQFTPSSGSADCVAAGKDPDPGSGMPNNKAFHEGLGLQEIEKLEDASGFLGGDWFSVDGLAATSGSVTIEQAVYDQWSDVHIAFRFGNQNNPPDWFSYALSGVLDAEWSIFQGDNDWALSNVALWGKENGHTVPEPMTLGLLGVGLLGLGVAARRRLS